MTTKKTQKPQVINKMKFFSDFKIKSPFTGNIRRNILAGLSVAALTLPQTMAYALIAGLEPIYGLYTAIVAMLAGAIFGVSNHLIIGPANIIALAIASNLSGIPAGESYLEAVLLFTFMIGVLQLILSALKLGNLVSYISRSVISGLTTGVSLLIISGQLKNYFGLNQPSGVNIIQEIYYFFNNISEANLYAIFIASFTMVMIILFRKITPELPEYLLAMIFSISLVYLFNWDNLLPVTGQFPAGLPGFNPWTLDGNFILEYLPGAFSVALLGFMYTLSTVKALEIKTGEKTDYNRVFWGQALVNISCSFFSSFASAGSFTKSYANYQAGATSKMSELFAALTIIPFLLIFRDIGKYIPISALAGLVIVVAAGMIDLGEIRDCFRNKFDALIFSTTFVTTLLAPRLDYAIYLGLIISFLLLIKDSSSLNYYHLQFQPSTYNFIRKDIKEVKDDNYIIINLSGNVSFNATAELHQRLKNSYQPEKNFIIRLRDVEDIDVSSLQELEIFINKVHQHQGQVFICGLSKELSKIFASYGLTAKVGRHNIFTAGDCLFAATKAAIDKAQNG